MKSGRVLLAAIVAAIVAVAAGGMALGAIAADAVVTGPVQQLNGPMAAGGDVRGHGAGFEVSADASRVVYLADQDADEVFELYSRPTDGSGAAVKLNEPISGERDVHQFAISPDSSRVVYLADQQTVGRDELYVVPINGGTKPLKLNHNVGSGDVIDFEVSGDSSRVVYLAGRKAATVDLYSRSITGAGQAVPLSGTMVAGGDVDYFTISPDSSRVVYRADQTTDDVFELYTVPITGPAGAVRLNADLDPGHSVDLPVAISPDSTHVVFLIYRHDDELAVELYSRPIDGTGTAVKLSAGLPGEGADIGNDDGLRPQISGDSTRVVYIAAEQGDDVVELHSVPVDGNGPPLVLNGPLEATHDVHTFAITPDSSRVVYLADEYVDDVAELYTAPIAVAGASARVSAPFPSDGYDVYDGWVISPDSSRVVYMVNSEEPSGQDSDLELYSASLDVPGSVAPLSGPLAGASASSDLILVSPDSIGVVYGLGPDANGVTELNWRPIDGSALPTTLNSPLTGGGQITHARIASNSLSVVYRADQQVDDTFELFSFSWIAARDDTATVMMDDSVNIQVLDNDTVAVGSLVPASVTVTSGPNSGSATVDGGPVTYSPVPGFAGSDAFTYVVCSAEDPPLCDTAIVSITVLDPTPPTTAPPTTAPPTTKPPTTKPPAAQPSPTAPRTGGSGYWVLEADGDLVAFGNAPALRSLKPDLAAGASAVALAAHPDGKGVWALTSDGDIVARGSAVDFGRVDLNLMSKPGEVVSTLSATPDGRGLWVFTTAGRVIHFGSALPGDQMAGTASILGLTLDGPVIDSVATPSGRGAYMVASDGGVFAVGDATFVDSTRGVLSKLYGPPGWPDQPVVGLVPDPDGVGYWNVAADGGVFAFTAPFRGSLPAIVPFDQLHAAVNGMVPYGDGYLLVAADGGVFAFSNLPFQGSAAGRVDSMVVDIATRR